VELAGALEAAAAGADDAGAAAAADDDVDAGVWLAVAAAGPSEEDAEEDAVSVEDDGVA
jgi:hypothetical protein